MTIFTLLTSTFTLVQAADPTIFVPRTGQTTCFDVNGAVATCAGSGQDGEKLVGASWPTQRFTDNGNGTVTDNLTRLVWLKNADCFGQQTWAGALASVAGLQSSACGLSDGSSAGQWFLPNRKELLSLIDRARNNPALTASQPFTALQSIGYWTSTTYSLNNSLAWLIDLGSGAVGTLSKSDNSRVLPLRATCLSCHALPQDKTASGTFVNDNNGVRAITGEFAKWSHHVTGVALNDAHCASCHLAGKMSGNAVIVDTTKHMADARIHLRDVDTDTDLPWDPATPSHSTMDTFCLTCHDSNGATSPVSLAIQAFINTNSLAAPGKTASPQNPFGDTISNQYDLAERSAVVDVNSQFITTNNSHHAVKGKRYSGRTRIAGSRQIASPATFAANSSAALPGMRTTIYDAGKFEAFYVTLADAAGESGARNGGTTLGDDSTLHCGDCHTVGQFAARGSASFANMSTAFWSNSNMTGGITRYYKQAIGAHGSNNEYLLRNNVGTDMLHQGAETVIAGGNADNGTYGTKAYLVCFNCHAFKTYGTITANNGESGNNHAGEYIRDNRCNGPANTIFGQRTGQARLDSYGTATSVANYGTLYGPGSSYGNRFGIQCANCHNSGVKGNIFGGIHGSKEQTYTDGMGNTTKHFRFMPGLGDPMYVPGVKGGFTGGTIATYKAYSGNRNGTGIGNTLGQTWTQLPSRTIKYTAKGDNANGSYNYVTGGVSNDLNWEQRTQQPIAGETDLMSRAVGCYAITPNAPNYTYSAAGNITTQGSAPTGLQKNPKIIALQAGGYPADDIRNATSTGLTAGNGEQLFGNWGGCDDHNGAQGAGTGMVRKVLRRVNY